MKLKVNIVLGLIFSSQLVLAQEVSKITLNFKEPIPVINATQGANENVPAGDFLFQSNKDLINIVELKNAKDLKLIINKKSDKNDQIIIDDQLIKAKLGTGVNTTFKIEKISSPDCDGCGRFIGESSEIAGKMIEIPLYLEVWRGEKLIASYHVGNNQTGKNKNDGGDKKNEVVFIPILQDYHNLYENADIRKRKRESGDLVLQQRLNLKKNILTYDFSGHHDLLYRSKKLKAGINRNIVFEVININPYTHTVIINNSQINLHTEGATYFGSFFQLPSVSQDENNTAQSDEENGDTSSDKQTLLELEPFLKLKDQLQVYYNNKIVTVKPDIDLLAEEVDLINTKIKNQFLIEGNVSKEKLLILGNNLVSRIKDGEIKQKYTEIVFQAANLYEKVTNINFNVTSGVIQPKNNDLLRFNLEIKKGNTNVIEPQQYEIMLFGGWKIDFSAGIFGSNLIDHEFTTQRVSFPDTTFYVDEYFITTDSITGIGSIERDSIMRNDNGSFNLGVGMLAHLYTRTGYRVNPALTAGFIVGTDSRIKYLVGGSLILGYERRFIISGGMALGQVKRLGTGLKEGGFITPSAGQNTSVPTRDAVWKDGWFVGITVNLGGINVNSKKASEASQ